ncbi:hypothetical protein DNL40_02430 [Xylanimonas oleitrophica]|uniref:Uncharacterized protein n=1 Tax=Xylanimonas oleitrophica TaxID=2607479 RepID=A0A2W5WVC6_9MICO|nr:hypothetical protein [Xylanimonas oleitrophica]PZR55247.1 hypothetical protein DNL40_02430 [Xylanimonas oleitrophica]
MTRNMQPCTLECGRDVEDTCYVCAECGTRLTTLLTALADTPEPDPAVLTHPSKPHHEHCELCDLPKTERRRIGHPDLNPLRRTGLPQTRPGLLADAEDRIAHGQTVDASEKDEHGHTVPGTEGATHLPYRYTPSEARWDLLITLTSVADTIAKRRGLYRPLNTPQALAGFLTGNIAWMRAQPDGGDLIGELLDAIQRMKRAIDVPPQMQYAGPCTADVEETTTRIVAGTEVTDLTVRPCHGELYARPGATDVTCPGCGTTYALADRRAWLLDQVADMLLPATEMARAVHGLIGIDIKADTLANNIRWWHHAGRLLEAGKARNGANTYRVRDVIDLVINSARTRARAKQAEKTA